VVFLLAWCLVGFIPANRAASGSLEVPVSVPTPPAAKPDTKPANTSFKGISIGMLADDVRKKLGVPKEKSDAQDFYVFSDDETGQIVYDAQHAVSAISFDYTGKSGAPLAKDVLGVDIAAKPDGAMYDLIRYPKAGYWISYNKTGGSDPMVSITMQKIP
jgi:hypothetical protein